jgi:hypothetical protein
MRTIMAGLAEFERDPQKGTRQVGPGSARRAASAAGNTVSFHRTREGAAGAGHAQKAVLPIGRNVGLSKGTVMDVTRRGPSHLGQLPYRRPCARKACVALAAVREFGLPRRSDAVLVHVTLLIVPAAEPGKGWLLFWPALVSSSQWH